MLSPREDQPLNSSGDQFTSDWPPIFKSHLFLAYVVRRLVWLFVGLYVLSGIFIHFVPPESRESFDAISSLVAFSFMFLLTVVEFPVCGLISLTFSTTFCSFVGTLVFASQHDEKSLIKFVTTTPLLWLIFSTLVHLLAGFLILPAQFTFNGLRGRFPRLCAFPVQVIVAARTSLIETLGGEVLRLRTADKVEIDAMVFLSSSMRAQRERELLGLGEELKESSNQNQKNLSAVILFNGNNESFEFKRAEISLYLQQGFTVLVFNYRGVSASQGYVTRDGTILDGDACYQYLHNTLGLANRNICLIGTSLGGAVATEIATFREGCVLCNDRSFSSLSLEASIVAPMMFGISARTIKGRIFSALVRALVCFGGWEYDSIRNWNAVKGHKFLQYHSEDVIIPEPARLWTVLRNQSAPLNCIELRGTEVDSDVEEMDRGQVAHCRLLTREEMKWHMKELKIGVGLEL